MKLLLATNNLHKVEEIRRKIDREEVELLTLKDLNFEIEVEEDKDTLEGNSLKKAFEIFQKTGYSTLADDTGLFVDALNGAPGVYSSRYAGENATYDDNCRKLLSELQGVPLEKRTASFITVICLVTDNNKHYFFEGKVEGIIKETKSGENGFGYDPLFIPAGFNKTYAEMNSEEKNQCSHRAKALEKFKNFLMTSNYDKQTS